MNGPNQIQTRNRIEWRNRWDQPKCEDETWRREGKEVIHFLRKPYHTKWENTEINNYCRVIDEVPYTCCIHGKATATATATVSTKKEEERYSGIIIIRMVPIGQFSIHHTRHTILIMT